MGYRGPLAASVNSGTLPGCPDDKNLTIVGALNGAPAFWKLLFKSRQTVIEGKFCFAVVFEGSFALRKKTDRAWCYLL